MTGSVSPIGNIIGLTGQAWAESASGVRPLEAGSAVFEGEKILTGPDSSVEIRFLDDTCLSQGADSTLSLDEYVYNPADEAGSKLGFGLLQGAFRHVSGKIAVSNPENVQLESPLAVIGIRGTVTVHSIRGGDGGEVHGVEHISDGHRVIIQDSFGEIRIINDPHTVIDLSPDQPMGFIRPMTPQELEFFHSFAPGVLELLGFSITPEGLAALFGGTPGDAGADTGDEGEGDESGSGAGEDGSPSEDAANSDSTGDAAGDQSADPTVSGGETSPAGTAPGDGGGTLQAGPSTTGIIAYADLSPDSTDSGLFGAAPQLSAAGSSTSDSSGPDLPPPPGVTGSPDSSSSGATSSYPEQEVLPPAPQEPTGSATSISDPSNWEYMNSGGYPNYSWLPAGYESVPGTDGSDTLSPTAGGPYALFGFGDDDYLSASANHMFYGGAGNDTIVGSSGADTIYGGTGDDIIIVQGAGHANNYLIDGGSGTNSLQLMAGSAAENVFASDAGLKNISSIELLGGTTGASGVNLNLQSENFTILGNAERANTINGGSGNDSITGGLDDDLLVGGAGNDTINGGDGHDTIVGGPGVDSLAGGAGNDVFVFQSGDVVSGEGINGGAGAEDEIVVQGDVDFRGAQILGIEYLSIEANGSATFDADAHGADWSVWGDDGGNETLRVVLGSGGELVDLQDMHFSGWNGTDLVSVQGGSGNDTIYGAEVDNYIDGGAGDDVLETGPGNDTMIGGAGNDSLYGDAGDDSLVGSDGNDTLEGDDGNDTLVGGAGSDLLLGGDDDDLILAGAGDTVSGGAGEDVVRSEDATLNVTSLTTINGVERVSLAGIGGTLVVNGDAIVTNAVPDPLIVDAWALIVTGDAGDLVRFSGDTWDWAVAGQDVSIGDGSLYNLYEAVKVDQTVRLYVQNTLNVDSGINTPPTFTGSVDLGSMNEDGSHQITTADLLVNALDADGDTLSVTGLTAGSGVLDDNGDGTWTFTPSEDWHGSVTFNYTVEDGRGGTVGGTADLFVNPVNDAPVASDGEFSAQEDLPTIGSLSSLVSDVDGDSLEFLAIVAATSQGGTATITAAGDFTYTPPPDFNGTDTFSYTVSDGSLFDTGTVTITVDPVNDAPAVAGDLAATLDEGSTYTLTTDDLVAIDPDNSADEITFSVTSGPANGNLSLTTFTLAQLQAGLVTYTHDGSDAESDSFSFTLADDAGGDGGSHSFNLSITLDQSLVGTSGPDNIDGGFGNDTINGGAGADTLTGGAGNDVFVYTSLVDSRTGDGVDTIVDFTSGEDKIRLVELSAKTTFVYQGTGAFSGTDAQARLDGDTLRIDVDGDGNEDMQIHFSSVPTLVQGDFVWEASSSSPWLSLTDNAKTYFYDSTSGEFASYRACAALRSDGSVVTWGNTTYGGDSSAVSSQIDGTIDVVQIYGNHEAFAALRLDGSVVTWGSVGGGGNSSAVAGMIDGTLEVTDIFSTWSAFAALRADGSVVTWGNAGNGGDSSSVSVQLNGDTDVVQIFSSIHAFAALREDGSVVTWGNAAAGGDSSAVAGQLNGDIDVVNIAWTTGSCAALRADGSVVTWGNAADGGDSGSVAGQIDGSIDVQQILATDRAFAALRVDGSVITWGRATHGGDSSTVAGQIDGSNDVVKLFSAAWAFAALRADGSVVTWGDAGKGGDSSAVAGQLNGSIDVVDIFWNGWAFAALRADGSVVTWGDAGTGGDSSSVAAQLDGTIDVVSVFSTSEAFAALRADGSVVTWGLGASGGDSSAVAGQINGTVDVVQIFATAYSFAALRADGSLITWGNAAYGGDSSAVAGSLTDVVWVASPFTDDVYTAPDNPDNWETMSSGGHANYDWLPAGYDTILGTDGAEALIPAGGPFAIFGFDNQDQIAGDVNDDLIYGGAGSDTLHGGSGSDTIYGGTGNDYIHGGEGNDSITGGAGDDTLIGGFGADTMAGGLGEDFFGVDYPNALIGDTIDGGLEQDTWDFLRISAQEASQTFDLSTATIRYIDVIEIGSDVAGTGIVLGSQIAATADLEQDGTFGEITVYFNNGTDATTHMTNGIFVDGSGMTSGQSLFFEGPGVSDGSEYYAGFDGDDTVLGGQGADDLLGGKGNDFIDGGAGNDDIGGGDGDDTLIGGLGRDSLIGGLGADRFRIYAPAELIDDTIDGGLEQGTYDRLALVAQAAGQTFDLTVAHSIQHIDRIDIVSDVSGTELVLGSTIAVTADANGDGTLGDIKVQFRDGIELNSEPMTNGIRIDGSGLTASQSLWVEGEGYEDGGVWYAGFAGDDTIIGGAGSDRRLYGGAGDDSISGNGGNDYFSGGLGADTLIGGAGDDRFIYYHPDELTNDVVVGGSTVGESDRLVIWPGADNMHFDLHLASLTDIDRIDVYSDMVGTRIDLSQDLVASSDYNGDGTPRDVRVAFRDAYDDSVSKVHGMFIDGSNLVAGQSLYFNGDGFEQGGVFYSECRGDDTVYGGAGSDIINGGPGNDFLDAGPGDDTISGGTGNDSLYGDAGDDSLVGGDGDDTLEGASGADTLTGGAGNDVFVYSSPADSNGGSFDTITDFATTYDKIRLVELSTKTTFVYQGTNPFSGSNAQARLDGDTLRIDVDGDGNEDMQIHFSSAPTLVQGDFVWVPEVAGYPTDDPDNWETVAQQGGSPDFTWFTDAGFQPTYGMPADNDGGPVVGIGNENRPYALFGFGGNDTIGIEVGETNDHSHYFYGGAGNDVITGWNYNDTIYGGTGNDLISGGAGDDFIDGGAGHDLVIYYENSASSVFGTDGAGRFTVTDIDTGLSAEGSDVLDGIEQAQFADGLVSLNIDGEFQVNTTTANDQWNSVITSLPDGGYVIAWVSGDDGDGFGIFFQRYAADGNPAGIETRANSFWQNFQMNPSIASLPSGGFVITWTSDNVDATDTNIFARHFDVDGTPLSEDFQVNTTTSGWQSSPAISVLTNGGYVISWESPDADSTGIFARQFDADGNPAGAEFQVNTYSTSEQYALSIASLNNGGFIVTWASDGQDGSGYGVYAQRYNSDGTRAGGEFRANTHTLNYQGEPAVAALAAGGFVIVWTSEGQDGSSYGIYGQQCNAEGSAVGAEFKVNSHTSGGQYYPKIAGLSDGGFVITWTSEGQDGSVDGIFAQLYDASGNQVGTEFLVNTNTADSQVASTVTALPDSGFVITWKSENQDESEGDIYAQRFAADGSRIQELSGDADANTLTWSGNQGGRILGLDGDDTLTGGDGNDYLHGGEGNDSIVGGAGNDTMLGGGGDDTLAGGLGSDSILGGDGNDSVQASIGNDTIDGGTGSNTISYWFLPSNHSVFVDLSDKDANRYATAQIKYLGSTEHEQKVMGFQTVYGTVENDTIIGDTTDNTIYGGEGADFLGGGPGNDHLYGGPGNDTIEGGLGADTIAGGSENDVFAYLSVDDSRTGGDVDVIVDFITTQDKIRLENLSTKATFVYQGTNAFSGSDAQARLDGDMLLIDVDGDGTEDMSIQLVDVTDLDQSDFIWVPIPSPDASPDNWELRSQYAVDVDTNWLFGWFQANTPTYWYLSTSDADDNLILNAVNYSPGYDQNEMSAVFAFGGNDTIDASDSNAATWLFGGAGDDSITGGVGDSTIHGGSDNDTIYGGSGSEDIDGGPGNDSILAGDGDDNIAGSEDADTIDGGGGNNTVDYYLSPEAVNVDLREVVQSGGWAEGDELSNIHNLFGSWSGNDTLIGTVDANVMGGSAGHDSIDALGGDDWIEGAQGNDTIYGGDGNDWIQGDGASADPGDGDDLLYGGDGNDTILGGGGNDTIIGGLGLDSLTGGDDADVFIYTSTDCSNSVGGIDTITDFTSGTDKLQFELGSGLTLDYIVDSDFSGDGAQAEARYDGSTLYIDADGNGTADMEINLSNGTDLHIDDFSWT